MTWQGFVAYIQLFIMNSKQLYIETFGCQMNVNDSNRIVGLMAGLGYCTSQEPGSADMILLNTCSVRGGAEEKVYNRLENLRVFKRANKKVIIGVGGCVAQQEGEALLLKFPWLDLVFGTHNLHLLMEMVRSAESGQQRCETAFLDNDQRLDLFPPVNGDTRLSSFVTIMQGCDNYCSYCIVPYVRGREISRRSSEIINEVRHLADSGVKEVVLLGQNVNSYGLKAAGEPNFAELVQQIAEIDEISRIRFFTSHPKDISQDLITCYRDVPKLCGHIHLPAQSGSDAVLSKMNRGYDRSVYLQKVRDLRAARPGIAITGDMIIGFPGETEEDFEQTLSLMEEVRYMDLFYFVYSPRPGTKSADLPEKLTRRQKQARLERLQELQRRITMEFHQGLVDSVHSVMVEGEGKRPGQISGRADNGRFINFIGDKSLIGSFVDVRIITALQNSLLGELI